MKILATGIRFIQEFRKIDSEMPMQMASILLRVALHDKQGVTMKQLAELEGLSQASVSRNVAALSKVHRLEKPGHDLVVATEDPAERRRKIVRLTPKGRQLAASIGVVLVGS